MSETETEKPKVELDEPVTIRAEDLAQAEALRDGRTRGDAEPDDFPLPPAA